MKQVLAFCLMAGALLVVGCTLATSADRLTEGCPEGMKACDGFCVDVDDEEFGCGRASCSPCALPNSVPGCSAEGECIIASCIGSWDDCDRKDDNGCEVNIDARADHCGGCGLVCDVPKNGEAGCGDATCYVRACESPFFDCNLDASDGCETDLSTSEESCGACAEECGKDEACESGECIVRLALED